MTTYDGNLVEIYSGDSVSESEIGVIREEVESSLESTADSWDVDLDELGDEYGTITVGVGNIQDELPLPSSYLSDPEDYHEVMEDFLIDEEAEEYVASRPDMPVHEIHESMAHMVADLTVGYRDRSSDLVNLAINEYFGGLGLGMADESLLRNDMDILERNLELLNEFHGDEQLEHVSRRMGIYRDFVRHVEGAEDMDEMIDVMEDVVGAETEQMPARISEEDKYSWSKAHSPGTFSEYFVENIVTPAGYIFDDSLEEDPREVAEQMDWDFEDLSQRADKNSRFIASLTSEKLEDLNRITHRANAKRDVAYLVARRMAQNTLEKNEHEPSVQVQKDNRELSNDLGPKIHRDAREIAEQMDVPSKEDISNPSRLRESYISTTV